MKRRTAEYTLDIIQADFAWRRKELTDLRSYTREVRPSGHDMMVRASIALLYAHWEGLIKFCGETYLAYVARQGLIYNSLSDSMFAAAIESRLKQAEQTSKIAKYIDVVEFFRSSLSSPAKLPYDPKLATKSNLSSKILREIIIRLGLDYTKYELKENLIDSGLLKRRNEIAHGEHRLVDAATFNELYEEVTILMQQFYDDICNAIQLKAFQRASIKLVKKESY